MSREYIEILILSILIILIITLVILFRTIELKKKQLEIDNLNETQTHDVHVYCIECDKETPILNKGSFMYCKNCGLIH